VASIDDVLKVVEAAEPRKDYARIPLDPNVLADLADLEAKVKAARLRDKRTATAGSIAETLEAPALEDELARFRDEADKAAQTFWFRELKRPEWNAVVRKYPSSDPRYLWNADLFEPALVAACCTDPVMDEEQARRLFGSLGNTGAAILFTKAYGLQERPDRVPFGGSGTDETPDSEPSSTTAPLEGSAIADS
jgi:hypothetical protein